MNFHKTIGYLAALLLMVGIGVPDSFAQADVKSITLSINKSTLRDSTTTPVTVTATVGVTLTKAVGQDSTISVVVSVGADDSYSAPDITIPVTVSEGRNSKSGVTGPLVFTFTSGDAATAQGDADTEDETVTVTAQENGADADDPKDTRTIKILDYQALVADDAATPRGMRVVIAAPAANAWAPTGKDKIKVQVLRRNGLAKEYGAFTSIKVSLFNDPDKDGSKTADVELYSLTIDNQVQLGSLAVPRIRSAELTGTAAAGTATGVVAPHANTKAFYTKGVGAGSYDKLEFRFHLNAGGGPFEYVYAVAEFGLTPVDTENNKIESRDTETSIYPPNPSALPDKVGDGKHIKIDPTPPVGTIVSGITIQIGDGDPIALTGLAADATPDVITTAGAVVGIGKTLKISADIADFEENTLHFEIVGRDGKGFDDPDNPGTTVWVTSGAGATLANGNPSVAPQVISGYAKTIQALAVISATSAGDPLTDEVKVTANQFKRKANIQDHPGKDFKKNALYEDDNVIARVRAFVKDRAGNKGNQTALSPPFILDSRPPKITIAYPKPSATDSARFTAGVTQTYEFLGEDSGEQSLKPLKYSIDESTTTEWVIIGTDTLTVKAAADADPAGRIVDGEDLVGYNITEADGPPLKNPMTADDKKNKHPAEDAAVGGSNVALQVVAKDLVGNKGTGTPDGQAIFDSKAPGIIDLFPNNDALADYDNKIGGSEQTQHPVFQINEKADSILVRFEGDRRLSVAGTAAQLSMVNENIRVSFIGDNALVDGETYDLQVYVRDLAKNVGISDADPDQEGNQPEIGLSFDNDLDNPDAGGFEIVSEVRDNTKAKGKQAAADYTKIDSVVAGQALRLTITAVDTMLTRLSGETRPAITYNNDGVKVVAMDSDGNAASSVSYWGSGVTDNGDGSATLDGAGWAIGTRKIFVASEAAGTLSFVAKDLTGAGVVNFMGTKEDVVVDAADFAEIELTAWEDGVVEAATSVWGTFTLRMIPVDRFGNPSLKSFFDQTPKTAGGDSLNILDTRLKDDGNSAIEYGDGVDIQLQATPPLVGLLSEVWGVGSIGHSLSVTAPASSGSSLTIQARVRRSSLEDNDDRSENNRGSLNLTIQEPLDISITLWVPGQDGDQAGNDVVVSAEGVTVTARAEGFNEGDMVTFTVDGVDQDAIAADADGYAGLSITRSMADTVTVSAASGQYSADELTVVFTDMPDEPVRMAYADANGDPVYLIAADGDMTVGVDDFQAFVMAFGSSAGDDNYNLQADINDDGMVNVDDFIEFINSWGRTATGPATKPIVLLPGINENAEFSLSLGSERVVAGEFVAVDVSLANVEAVMGYGFTLNYDMDKFEFVSVASADEDLLASTGGETLFHHVVADGQVTVANGLYNGTAVSGGGDIVRFVFRVLYEFEDNARFEVADGLVFDPSQLSNPAVVAGVLELQSTPREFALHQNFPNPFNPDTTINYDLAESADVTLQIYNVLGQVVRTLVASEAQNAGRYQIRWNGMDERGVPVSSGIYFYQISADGKFSDVRKLMLLK